MAIHRGCACLIGALGFALVAAAGCGDGGTGGWDPTTGGPMPTPTPPVLGGPLPGGPDCAVGSDLCQGVNATLLAIAHSHTDPTGTILYRVKVPAWSTGTDWGDGTNGFFYRATVDGNANTAFDYVPFNGVRVGSDGRPQLPAFSFIVPVATTATMLEIDACATNYSGGSSAMPPCTKMLWSESYPTLPKPAVGPPPWGNLVLNFDFVSVNSLSLPNNGVYTEALELAPTVTENNVKRPLTTAEAEWFYDHLVFFDSNSDPYRNDIFDDTSAQHRSFGALTIEEAGYPTAPGATTFLTKYGKGPLDAVSLPNRQFFFYTRDGISPGVAINAGGAPIYDQSSTCLGAIGAQDNCGQSGFPGPGTGAVCISNTTCVLITPETGQDNGVQANAPNTPAGSVRQRSIAFQETGSSRQCTSALNPLGVSVPGAPPNPPNYVIERELGRWGKEFPRGLYYVLPAGFGNCDSAETPFCHLTSSYVAYVPHYTDPSNIAGDLNGGSTEQRTLSGFALADKYAIGTVGAGGRNSLVWFDNCGYGYTYMESPLGTRKQLPQPPSGFTTFEYTVMNALPRAVVFGKEFGASWYQSVPDPRTGNNVQESPQQLDHDYGMFVAAGQSVSYATVSGDEAIVVYDATTGNKLHKLRLHQATSAVFSCVDPSSTVLVTGSGQTFVVDIGSKASGALTCAPVADCPFGMTAERGRAQVMCTALTSSYLLGIADWAREGNAAGDIIRMQAWGGVGGTGKAPSGAGTANSKNAGQGGGGGFSLTVRRAEDLGKIPGLYAYVASQGHSSDKCSDVDGNGFRNCNAAYGGPSTILTTQAYSEMSNKDATLITNPVAAGAILVAGGGAGGSGNVAECFTPCGAGGAAGVALANLDPPGAQAVSAAGADGPDDSPDTMAQGGTGGNKMGVGHGSDSPTSGNAGNSGLGGVAGGGADWAKGSLVFDSKGYNAGVGGAPATYSNGWPGAGGSGFGGGSEGGTGGNLPAGGGGGGSWAAANTVYDPSFPKGSAIPASPGGGNGAVQFVYKPNALPGSGGLCPFSTSSFSATGGMVSCVLTESGTVDSIWLRTLVERGILSSDTELRLTAWGGSGGDGGSGGGFCDEGGGLGGGGGMAGMTTTAGTLTSDLYVYVGSLGCSPADGHQPACGGASTVVMNGSELHPIETPSLQNVLLLAGGGGAAGGGDQTCVGSDGGLGGRVTSTTTGVMSRDGNAGGTCGSTRGSGGSMGIGGAGAPGGASGIGGLGGGKTGWISGRTISLPSSWTLGNGGSAATTTFPNAAGGGGGGGYGGGGAASVCSGGQCCGGCGGGGGASYASRSSISSSYPAASTTSPGGQKGAFEIYYVQPGT